MFIPGGGARFLEIAPPILLAAGILKRHGNGQFGESFRRCVRCGFVVSVVLHELEYSPSPLKIVVTCKKKLKKS